jgi:HlyD family secretion protein
VRTTEIRVAPEVGGQLAAIKVQKGARVRAGDVVAELSADELSASVVQARAALAAATADRDNVYAGVRAEEVAALEAGIAKAKAKRVYAQQQLDRTAYLARSDTASQQSLDQATNDAAVANADVAEAQANYDAAKTGAIRKPATSPLSPCPRMRWLASAKRRSRRGATSSTPNRSNLIG